VRKKVAMRRQHDSESVRVFFGEGHRRDCSGLFASLGIDVVFRTRSAQDRNVVFSIMVQVTYLNCCHDVLIRRSARAASNFASFAVSSNCLKKWPKKRSSQFFQFSCSFLAICGTPVFKTSVRARSMSPGFAFVCPKNKLRSFSVAGFDSATVHH